MPGQPESKAAVPLAISPLEERTAILNAEPTPVGGIPGPGRWLVARYLPTALFSLKTSQATSGVGKTLLVPTMYAVKMALVDAGFRAGFSDAECAALLRALVPVDVRIAPPTRAVVTHTFVKIRQEPKVPNRVRPYLSSVAYREVVHFSGEWLWAFDLAAGDQQLGTWLVAVLQHVSSVGKRGSFVQFMGLSRGTQLSLAFTQPRAEDGFEMPPRWHVAILDDLGPEASLPVLSTYTAERPRRGRHRAFVQTVVPLGLVNVGPGFTEYASAEQI